ncbi:MAG: SUMF1/EgtB/PvdO family nonheme iron enzyme [Planctomycetes bacterium]|nr:SUMF1/EgtB/PvdO family nonheme iron enzyme [Planctomycetota bacterium]
MAAKTPGWPRDVETRRFVEERLSPPIGYIRTLVHQSEGDTVRETARPEAPPAREGAEAGVDVPEAGPARERPGSSSAPRDGAQDLQAKLGLRPLAGPCPDSHDAGPPFAPAPDRYVFEAELASGGSAKVYHALDQDLQRLVAIKILRKEDRTPRNASRLVEEARATGQLEHPNIPPVYDVGVHPEHGVYFSMRLVRGRTLLEILRDLSIGRLETAQRFSLTRLVQILQQVAMGVHYAHVRGVIHRDLKPANIMVGDFGEVLVMDWGVAKVAHRAPRSTWAQGSVVATGRDPARETSDGSVLGTLAYMSPEQARGWVEEVDVRSDVFGLGAILYEILTFHPPYDGSDFDEVLAKACAGEVVPPHVRAPRNLIPPSLEAICLKALAPSPDDRYPDAVSLHDDLQVFLDGTLEEERRRKEAAQLELEGKQKAREYLRLAELEEKLRLDARRRLETFQTFDPVSLKIDAWKLLEEAAETNEKRIQVFSDATAVLHSAISIDGDCAGAKETLATLYWHRFEEAERAGKKEEMAIYRRLVERHQQGQYTELLEDKGQLTLVSTPPGAVVYLHRITDRGFRLEEGEGRGCGATPLKLELPAGHYLAVLKKEGYRDTRAPILLKRCERGLARVNLYRDAEIGAGFIHVAQGEFICGGDPEAPSSLPLSRRYLGDFLIAESPVTFRQYCAFLDELRSAGDPELASWVPSTEKEGELVKVGGGGRHEPSAAALDIDPATAARHPEGFEWDLPAIGVSWFAATRYAAWVSKRTARSLRLLRDAEWEKAARGVSGSTYPWGSRFDWSLVKGGLSRPERAQLEPVGAFPTDRSIYGVMDMAGTVREWCQDWFLEGKYRVTRGSAWAITHEGAFRAAQRSGVNPELRSSVIGFRLAADPPGRGE